MFGLASDGLVQEIIFYGLMDAKGYGDVLRAGLPLFIRETLPTHHRLMHDNHQKHTPRLVPEFMEVEGVNWWKSKSPNRNPLKNVWYEFNSLYTRA